MPTNPTTDEVLAHLTEMAKQAADCAEIHSDPEVASGCEYDAVCLCVAIDCVERFGIVEETERDAPPVNSGHGLANELEAWDAASDEALEKVERFADGSEEVNDDGCTNDR